MVETIGQARHYGWKAKARCAYGKREGMKSIRACVQNIDLDMDTLLWTRGRDFPLARLGERLRCPRCGSRDVSVMFIPPAGADAVRQG
jgi:transposase-like protein